MKRVNLPSTLQWKLNRLPEQGMGYQIVSVTFKDGTILDNVTAINSTFLLLDINMDVEPNDIVDVNIN